MSEMEEKDKIKKVAELRAILEKRVEEMETELEGMKALLGAIDTILIKNGFKRAEVPKQAITAPKPEAATPAPAPQKKGIQLKTVTGELLAEIFTDKDSMQIVLAEDKDFDVNIPPFNSFFVERVLAKMQEKDREEAGKGRLDPDKMLSYDIKRDGNIIREITVNNLRRERFRELKSSIRWTLEKMFEKMQQKS